METNMKIIKRILLAVLILIIGLFLIYGVLSLVFAPSNTKAMNISVDTYCDTIREYYTLTEVDCGEYSNLKLYGLIKFNTKQYNVEGIGNLAIMTTNMGIMQMATIVLTPTMKDIPLISVDYVYMLGNRKAYIEFFDLVLSKDANYSNLIQELEDVLIQYSDLETVTSKAAWYDSLKTIELRKKGKKADDSRLNEMLEQSLKTVMLYAQTLPELDANEQNEKASLQKQYSDGLIDNGGISTDIFLKALGAEETRKFFDSFLFKTLTLDTSH